jgi:putative transcriptional regulator
VAIVVNLDVMLAKRNLQLNQVAERVGITPQNLSVLNAGRARAIRFSTLERLCESWNVSPVTLLEFEREARSRHVPESAPEDPAPQGSSVPG